MQTTNRISWIDSLKVFGIFFVVLGHLPIPEKLGIYIYAFHMPLFFFISGYLITIKKFNSYTEFLSKKIKTLLIPYVIFNIITYLFWLIIGRKFGTDTEVEISIFKPLIGILYSNGIDNWLIHNIPLWFLTCLFMVEVLYYTLSKYVKNKMWILLIIFAIIGFVDSKYMPIRLPWGIDVAFTAFVFYGLGNLVKEYQLISFLKNKIWNTILFILSISLYFIFSSLNGRVDMNTNDYNNIFYFYIAAISGISASILFCKSIPANSIITYIGQNTLIILVLHGLAITVIKGLQLFILHIPLDILQHSVAINVIYAATAIIILIPAMYIVNRFAPIAVGKKRYIKPF